MPTLLSINNYHYYRGGAETVFLEQNKMLAAQGWEVVPFAMHHPRNLETPWSKYFVDEIEFGSNYSFAKKLARAPKVIYSFEARRKLSALIDVVRPDVCHAHNLYNHISPSILSLLHARGIPTVLTLHDLKVACPAYNMLASDGVCERCKGGHLHNVLLNRCVKGSIPLSAVVMLEAVLHRFLGTYRRHVQRFVVPSRFYIQKLTEWGLPSSLFTHVPNFVDTLHSKPSFEAGKAFLYFGRLSPEKGLATLLRAAANAKVPVWIAGTGPQAEELKVLSDQLGIKVRFLGYLTGESLRDVVRSSRAVVLPSEWYENAPMTVLEAYALGKPVIGARIGGIPELIREDQTGLGFDSADVESLTAVLAQSAATPAAEIERMGRAGRAWVETEFTAEQYRQRILDVYRQLGVMMPAANSLS